MKASIVSTPPKLKGKPYQEFPKGILIELYPIQYDNRWVYITTDTSPVRLVSSGHPVGTHIDGDPSLFVEFRGQIILEND